MVNITQTTLPLQKLRPPSSVHLHKRQPYVCAECHGASLHAQSLADLKIIKIKKGNYGVISNISYNKITRLLETSDLIEKIGYL